MKLAVLETTVIGIPVAHMLLAVPVELAADELAFVPMHAIIGTGAVFILEIVGIVVYPLPMHYTVFPFPFIPFATRPCVRTVSIPAF